MPARPLVPSSCFRRAEGVRAAAVGDELVLLQLERGTYSTLNPTGAWLWERLATESTLGELHAALVVAFEVDADAAWNDLVELVRDLLAEGLVTAVDRGSPG
jgi:hypothetical protein